MIKLTKQKTSIMWLVLIQLVLAYEWLNSGWGKFKDPAFMDGISKTLTTFSSKTPYHWYGSFLNSVDANIFGNITRFSEILVGLGLVFGAYYVLTRRKYQKLPLYVASAATLGGFLLNLNFYLAAAWSSPSTKGINVVMGLVQLVLGVFYFMEARKAQA